MRMPRSILGARAPLAALLLALLTALGACRSKPQVRHYQVAIEEVARASEPTPVVLGVDYLSANTAYDDVRIVYRKNPYRIDYYHYHRWSAPPSVMVSDVLRELFARSGRFEAVTSGYGAGVDLLLRGRLVAFEEVDRSEDEWLARVVLDLQLEDVRAGEIVWSDVITREQAVEERSPEGVARAMSALLRDVADELGPKIQAAGRDLGSSSPGAPEEGAPAGAEGALDAP